MSRAEQTEGNADLPEGGRVTLPYPAQARPVPEKFRGPAHLRRGQVHRLRRLRQQLPGPRDPGGRCLPGDPHPASTWAAAAPTAGAAPMSARRRPSP